MQPVFQTADVAISLLTSGRNIWYVEDRGKKEEVRGKRC